MNIESLQLCVVFVGGFVAQAHDRGGDVAGWWGWRRQGF